MTAIWLLSFLRPRVLMSMPSMDMTPSSSSTMRRRATMRVLLPAPVRPTIPTLLPAGMSKSNPLRTKGKFGLYLILTSRNRTAPLAGHFSSSAPASASVLLLPSPSTRQYCSIRSAATKFASRSLPIRTLQLRLCVTLSAKDTLKPARPAKVSSPPRASCCATAHRHAKATMRVPANSSRTASQHWAAQVRKYARCWASSIETALETSAPWASWARMVETPSSVSPSRA
mmetsp:Transcript_7287/g.15398  ORF Transcript_7287/g.15398 Transcript_7287/m.15398 type:complete len:229 (-) Transcript_7287:1159-1845(-)